MDKLAALVDRLLTRSQKGLLDWEETAVEECFQVSLADSTIRISKEERPGRSDVDFIIEIINGLGSVIEEFNDVRLDNHFLSGRRYYIKMKDIYEIARSKALGVDDLLDDILKELDMDEQISKKK